MGLTGPGENQRERIRVKKDCREELLLESKKGFIKKTFGLLFTLGMWFYTLLVFVIFISAVVNYNNNIIGVLKESLKISNDGIQIFLWIILILFTLDFLILFLWRIYNKKRYGKLTRRQYPDPTTEEEILDLQLVNIEDYKKLKEGKFIVFEKNPVRDLYKGEEHVG